MITLDLDNIGFNSITYENNNISFDYLSELINLNNLLSSRGINNITSFVRIDNQIKQVFGEYLYVLDVLERSKLNCEISWHPHTENVNELWEIYNSNHIVREMKCVRMGCAFMNNSIMKTLSNMDFFIDSSALPGCYRNDKQRKINWLECGNSAYRPFVDNYQFGGDPHHKILEVPMTTIYIHAPYDKTLTRRYINPTIRKEFFQPAFSAYCQYLPYLIVVFHPDQLIEGYEDDLYKYGFENFTSNLDFIIKELKNVKFKTMRQFYE